MCQQLLTLGWPSAVYVIQLWWVILTFYSVFSFSIFTTDQKREIKKNLEECDKIHFLFQLIGLCFLLFATIPAQTVLHKTHICVCVCAKTNKALRRLTTFPAVQPGTAPIPACSVSANKVRSRSIRQRTMATQTKHNHQEEQVTPPAAHSD